MGEPELIKNLIPEKFLQRAQTELAVHEDLNERFALVIRGYEEFNLQRFLESYKYDFELVLQDYLKCIQCNGICRTNVYTNGGTPMYQGLDYNAIKFIRGAYPLFKVFICPGVTERKVQIKEQLISGKVSTSEGDMEPYNQNSGEKFKECREKLIRGNVISLDKKRQEREWCD